MQGHEHRAWLLPKQLRVGGFVFVASLIVATCSQRLESPPVLSIEYRISPAPARVGAATITFKLIDERGKPIMGARIAIEADMSHAGMSPTFAKANEEGAGRYTAHLAFPMAGDWILLLHITLPGGKKVERQIDVRGVRPD